ncbi:Na+/H+ antiporter subunit C [soil metagenome]
MLLRRSIVKLIIGLAMLTNAANLLIFTSAGLVRGRPPLMSGDATDPASTYADPLPAAVVLTAVIIGFSVLAFAMVLVYRARQVTGTDDIDEMRTTEK